MDEGTQKHLDLEQDAALSSIGPKSTTPGIKVDPDMAEMTRRLEQAYTVLIEHLSEEELSLINATIIRMSILLINKVQKNDTQERDEEVREMDGADKGVRGVRH